MPITERQQTMPSETPPKSALRIARMVYPPRIAGWLFLLAVLGSHFYPLLTLPLAGLLLLNALAWPHAALWLALHSSRPKRAERRNILGDIGCFGFWTAAAGFNPWIVVTLAVTSTMNALSVGGVRLLLRGALAYGAGLSLALAVFGFRVLPDTAPLTQWLVGISLVIYAGTVSLTAYRQAVDLARSHRTIKDQSLSDELTGLRNRRFFQEIVPIDIKAALRAYRPRLEGQSGTLPSGVDLGFMLVDIDYFKEINDTYGHAAGDRMLVQAAAIFQRCLRDSDTVVRWGGDEFLLLVRHVDRRHLGLLAEKIHRAMAEHDFDLGEGRSLRSSCSIGYCPFPLLLNTGWLNWERTLHVADEALYLAKAGGRNAWVGVVSELDVETRAPVPRNLDDLRKQPGVTLESSLEDASLLAADSSVKR